MEINREAPVVQTKEIIINASPKDVWGTLVDIKNWHKWNKKIKKSSVQDEIEIGTVFTWKTNGSKIKSTIHTVSPHKAFGWSGKALGANAIHNWYLEPIDNKTKLKVEESMEGWIINLMVDKMNEKLEEDIIYWLQQLKIESEMNC